MDSALRTRFLTILGHDLDIVAKAAAAGLEGYVVPCGSLTWELARGDWLSGRVGFPTTEVMTARTIRAQAITVPRITAAAITTARLGENAWPT